MTDACATSGLLSLPDALTQIQAALPTQTGYQRVSLKDALNRVLFSNVHSEINVPSFRNSSMDGYAFHSSDATNERLRVIGTSWAGKPFIDPVKENECVRIFTGAFVPESCDTVVMQENVNRTNDDIHINSAPVHGDNIRHVADDTKKGNLLLSKGTQLTPANISLLASCGVADAEVYKSLRVGFFSTGDELVSLGSQLQLGEIFDSNRYTLHALLAEAGVQAIDLGVIADNPEAVETALLSAAIDCDVIITSGGVSVGEADFITDILEKIGKINLWKIAIKPGKPLVFGSIKKAAFFGLPGNPVSVMVTFQQIVVPALRKMMGFNTLNNLVTLAATTTEIIKKSPGRTEFQRGIVENKDGQLWVRSTGGQGSHMLSSMSRANCFIVLDQSSGDVGKGEIVNIQLLGKGL